MIISQMRLKLHLHNTPNIHRTSSFLLHISLNYSCTGFGLSHTSIKYFLDLTTGFTNTATPPPPPPPPKKKKRKKHYTPNIIDELELSCHPVFVLLFSFSFLQDVIESPKFCDLGLVVVLDVIRGSKPRN
jgi:hypothetical protein